MIIIPVKEGENIERALKRFKRKFEKTGVIKELRERQVFSKPSVKKRAVMKKAVYIQGLHKHPKKKLLNLIKKWFPLFVWKCHIWKYRLSKNPFNCLWKNKD